MRGGGLLATFLGLLLASCGLETVPSLADPPANYLSDSVTDARLSFVHDETRYSGTSFFAYVVYYRIYPYALATDNFSRLLDDRNKLATSPTVNQLMSLGYRPLVASSSANGVGARNLEIQPSSNGTKVTLSFEDFLNGGDTDQPELLLNDASTGRYLFRSTTLGETLSFDALRTDAVQRSDMATMTQEQLSKHEYEVNVFVAAYGYTDSLTEVFSTPVPWGVIRTIKP